jgi:hypothetical protein
MAIDHQQQPCHDCQALEQLRSQSGCVAAAVGVTISAQGAAARPMAKPMACCISQLR